ncbi:MAG: hypothetical protein BWY09_02081 [Candidatus Hydrogenedentes bacterium ADurb.Bin179]|nr:MAG: hypothetical protein BWY09_02081 [Candidatus Hydrogenedentes bacterium ADurb.Bin179]
MAGLRGARVVTAIETEQGSRWAESKLKALTGGDKITARFMRQDFFEFIPQFKLLVVGNHKPSIRNVDEAMKRRLHLIPFTVTIPPERRDGRLTEKLLKERDGILAWAVEGCSRWQRQGLKPPASVVCMGARNGLTSASISSLVCSFSGLARGGSSLRSCSQPLKNKRTATPNTLQYRTAGYPPSGFVFLVFMEYRISQLHQIKAYYPVKYPLGQYQPTRYVIKSRI